MTMLIAFCFSFAFRPKLHKDVFPNAHWRQACSCSELQVKMQTGLSLLGLSPVLRPSLQRHVRLRRDVREVKVYGKAEGWKTTGSHFAVICTKEMRLVMTACCQWGWELVYEHYWDNITFINHHYTHYYTSKTTWKQTLWLFTFLMSLVVHDLSGPTGEENVIHLYYYSPSNIWIWLVSRDVL